MTWTTARDELRALLGDGPTDKLRHRKRCFGECNGTNVYFKTFEFRRVTDFTSAAFPLGIWKSGVRLSAAAIAQDVLASGDFELAVAPIDGDVIEASYYIQWFIDSELDVFLGNASSFLGFDGTISGIPSGLHPAALHYAASEAYQKMAVRWRDWMSDTYRVDDAPKKDDRTATDDFLALAKAMQEKASTLRKNYYQRNDQAEAPLFGSLVGAVRKIP